MDKSKAISAARDYLRGPMRNGKHLTKKQLASLILTRAVRTRGIWSLSFSTPDSSIVFCLCVDAYACVYDLN